MNSPAKNLAQEEQLPISDLHAALARIGRQYHPHSINRIVNHPAIYPFVCGYTTGRIDVGPAIADTRNVLLMGEHGGVMFKQHQPALYEAHTQVVPEGRGSWAVSMVRAAGHWMFTRSDCMEIVTRCPHGNLAALALAKRVGCKRWFTNPQGWVIDRDPVPAEIYRMSIQDWLDSAPGLVERGQWFRRRLGEEFRRHGQELPAWPGLDEYDRQIGGAVEMMLGGQAMKAQVFFNRFAGMAGWQPITVVSSDPLTINTGYALLIFRDTDFWIASFL